MKKFILITCVVMMLITSVCFADRVSNAVGKTEYMELETTTTIDRGTSAGTRPSTSTATIDRGTSTGSRVTSKYVSAVKFTIDEPVYGRTLDFTAEAEGGVVVKDVIWQEKEAINDAGESTIVTAGTWQLRITFGLAEGKTGISTDKIIAINDTTGLGWSKDDNGDYYVDTSFVVATARPSNSSAGSRPSTGSSTNTRPSTSSDSKTLKEIEITIKEPEFGKGFDKAPVFASEGIEFDHIYWEGYELTGIPQNWVGCNNDDDAAIETKYKATIFFKLKEGYTLEGFERGTTKKVGVVNGTKELEVYRDSIDVYNLKTQSFEVKQPVDAQKLESVTIVVPEPVVGEALPKTCTLKTNFDKEAKEYAIPTEGTDVNISWSLYYHKVVEAGTSYGLIARIDATGLAIPEDMDATVNGKKATFEKSGNDVVVSYYFEMPKEEVKPEETKPEETKPEETKPEESAKDEMYNQFAFEITAPKIGEKPATTAKAKSDNYKVTKVEWLTKDTKFVEGETYTVDIHFEMVNKNIRSDYYATVNGFDADLPDGDKNYAKNTMYAEFTFPTLRDTSKKATWSNASGWALEELSLAANAGLIPTVLDKQDLKLNVTRKEFAHIAVRLYELISGKGIRVTSAPFKDTDDSEIAKAYTVGITMGVSDTEFAPDQEITREQMATMMARALEKAGVDTYVDLTKVKEFSDDKDMHNWSRNAIYFMSNVDIIKGMGDGSFGVKSNASREQSLLIAVRSVTKFAS